MAAPDRSCCWPVSVRWDPAGAFGFSSLGSERLAARRSEAAAPNGEPPGVTSAAARTRRQRLVGIHDLDCPTPVPFPPAAAALWNSLRGTSDAATGSGSTSVGSPTLVAEATSGPFFIRPINFCVVVASLRLASSALFARRLPWWAGEWAGAERPGASWHRRSDPSADSA